MPDAEKYAAQLFCLCSAARGAADVPGLFREAARAVHDGTGCGRVSLWAAGTEYAVDFRGAAREVETRAASQPIPVLQSVLQQRQPRLEGGHAPALCLPLLCRGEAVGVLTLFAQAEGEAATWERPFLEAASGILAVALDNLAAHARLAELQRFRQENVYLRDERKAERDLRPLTGDSPAMKAVRLAVQQVARTDSTVLILGETGTGKELVARAIHQLSPRRDRLLVTVNCAALAPGVLASELFGHEAGAFTGATRRRVGRFELANGGTLFLDEVGELPAEVQVMLLRVLQERVLERVGGNEPVPVDVRVLAATHRDLEAALAKGEFRPDLFYRLNVFPIRVPPLRERREDIPDLVRHFLHHFSRRMGKVVSEVSPATLEQLKSYSWPGNVRELENLVERAMIVSGGPALEVEADWLKSAPPVAVSAAPFLAEQERRAILAALERCHGRIYGPAGAAAVLGVKPNTLYGKMRKHRIEKKPADDRRPSS
jgi:formate hydrogenlyase transcriptional activator